MTEQQDDVTQDQGTDGVRQTQGIEDQISDPTLEEQPDEAQDLEETFPRKYVEELRDENARYRQRAGQADDLAKRLHRLMVEQTGRLADPDDLAFDEAHLEDEEALTTAVDALLESKPHLASRRPSGDIGQGASGAEGAPDLAALMRRAAN